MSPFQVSDTWVTLWCFSVFLRKILILWNFSFLNFKKHMWRGYQNLHTAQVLNPLENRSSIPFETAYELKFQAFSLFRCLVLSTWQISTRKKTNQKAVPQNYLPANLFKFKYHYTNRKSAKIVYPRWFIFMWISLLVLTFFFCLFYIVLVYFHSNHIN